MQAILFTNNIVDTKNDNQLINTSESVCNSNNIKTENEQSFLDCFEDFSIKNTKEVNLVDLELDDINLQEDETNQEIYDIESNNDKDNKSELKNQMEPKDETYSTTYVNHYYSHDLLNKNSQNNKIGEKKIDSVKYSLENISDLSVDSLVKTDILESTSVSIEEMLEDELNGDIDFIGTNLGLSEKNSNSELYNETMSNDTELNQKEIFKQIKEGIKSNSTNRSMQIMLKPHHLGKVNLKLKFFNNAMHINIFVENDNVENILKQSLEQIISTVNPTGLFNIGSVNISKIDDLSEINSKEDNEYSDIFQNYKINPFTYKIKKTNYNTERTYK